MATMTMMPKVINIAADPCIEIQAGRTTGSSQLKSAVLNNLTQRFVRCAGIMSQRVEPPIEDVSCRVYPSSRDEG